MPIRPENRARYPKDWKQIRAAILARAVNRCECVGECGLHCHTHGPKRCTEEHGALARFAKGYVVLTVAHLDHQPENCDPANLRAMCQRCHLRYDIGHHAKSRRKNRDAETGRLALLAGD